MAILLLVGHPRIDDSLAQISKKRSSYLTIERNKYGTPNRDGTISREGKHKDHKRKSQARDTGCIASGNENLNLGYRETRPKALGQQLIQIYFFISSSSRG